MQRAFNDPFVDDETLSSGIRVDDHIRLEGRLYVLVAGTG